MPLTIEPAEPADTSGNVKDIDLGFTEPNQVGTMMYAREAGTAEWHGVQLYKWGTLSMICDDLVAAVVKHIRSRGYIVHHIAVFAPGKAP